MLRQCRRGLQVQALLADVRRFNAEALVSAQQNAKVLAKRDAAVANASRLRDDVHKIEEEKSNLAAALDAVMDGAQIERRTARAKADVAQREVRYWCISRTLLLGCCVRMRRGVCDELEFCRYV